MFKIKYYIKYEYVNAEGIVCVGWDILTLPLLGSIETLLLGYLDEIGQAEGLPSEQICVSQLNKLN